MSARPSERRVPRLPDLLLRLCLPAETYEVVSGDLEELWVQEMADHGEAPARSLYRRQALASLVALLRDRPPARKRRQRNDGSAFGTLVQDLRYGARLLRRRPGFAATAILTLALGLAATTTLYSVIDAVLVKPLPYQDADRVLFLLGWHRQSDDMTFNVPLADVEDFRQRSSSFEAVEAYQSWSANLTGQDVPERLQAYRVTPGTFPLLGVEPALGRLFSAAPEDESSVLLSQAFFERRFAADPGIIGRTVTLDGTPYTVLGVMPSGFEFPIFNFKGDLWAPWTYGRSLWEGDRAQAPSAVAVARLRRGTELATAQAELDRIATQLATEHPATNGTRAVRAMPMQEILAQQLRPALLAAFAAVLLVLVMICATVANLLLVRGLEREGEVQIRSALGAGRWRLLRQLLTESLLLAALAGALGTGLALFGLRLVRGAVPEFLAGAVPSLVEARLSGGTLAAAVTATLVAALLFGAVPALRTLSSGSRRAMHGSRAGVQGGRLRKLLVAVQVALALVLLICTLLMTQTFRNLSAVDPGFEPAGVLAMSTSLPAARYDTAEARNAYVERTAERVARLPGVEAAGWVNTLPFSTSDNTTRFLVEGATPPPPDDIPRAGSRTITPGYLDALRIPLLRGRRLAASDGLDASCVVLVNRALETTHLGGDALGRRLNVGSESAPTSCEVVGVVGNVRHWELTREPRPEIYFSSPQAAPSRLTLAVRTSVPPETMLEAVRAELFAVDAEQPVYDVTTLARLVDNSIVARTAALGAMAAFGSLALVLAVLGLYGVVTYALRLQSSELGIRIALGAGPGHIARILIGEGLAPALLGLLAGALASLAVGRALQGLLYGVPASDPGSILLGTAVLFGAALLACGLPALRARRIDPVAAIRTE